MDSSDKQLQEELRALQEAHGELVARVVALEEGRGIVPVEAEVLPELETTAARDLADWPRRIAVVSFALGGAMILRVATQQGLLDATAGTWLGLVYAALLVASPLLPGRLGRRYPLLPYCGAVLPTLIVLESVLRFDQLSPALAAAALHGTALLGAFTAARARLERLAGIALAAAMAGSLGLIARPEAIPLCAYGVLLEVVASRELVRRRAWSVMRPLVMLPAALFLAAALLYAGKREAYAGVLPHVGIAVLGTWVVVLGYHLRILGKVASPAPGWLPFFSLWAIGLGAFLDPLVTSWVALGGAAGVGLVTMVVVRRGRLGTGAVGLAAASIFLVAGAAIAVPGRSLLLALWVLFAASHSRRLTSNLLALLAGLLALGAALFASLDAGLIVRDPALSPYAVVALLVVAALFAHYFRYRPAGEEETRPPANGYVAPISLFAGVVILYLVGRGLLALVVPSEEVYHLSQTVLLGLFAIIALLLGRVARIALPAWVGILALLLLIGRIVFMDLFTLQGIPLLLSIVTLGAASGIASMALRHRE
jgi:hypothetical protein